MAPSTVILAKKRESVPSALGNQERTWIAHPAFESQNTGAPIFHSSKMNVLEHSVGQIDRLHSIRLLRNRMHRLALNFLFINDQRRDHTWDPTD